ncbi:hypothetical protein NQ318_005601 [Aromia moschata]|uniref:Uncharacterized protein n=1 Tax=Aromia moschata TaxID=1265417 RepID=A0AAV8XT78_9CUCU|nr:hypothetical protein NQ318_005601 [Aromia moschata]
MYSTSMISKKDNLFLRPWQQRKFEHHRRKVKSALPAIDTSPPAYREHVAIKMKTKDVVELKEIIICYYKKMNYITRTSRIDNVWRTPQPNFLNRIAIYNSVAPKIEDINFNVEDNEPESRKRNSKCYACRSQRIETANACIEKNRQQRQRNFRTAAHDKSLLVQKSEPLPTIEEHQAPSSGTDNSNIKIPLNKRASTSIPKTLRRQHIEKEFEAKEPHSIVLSRGCLKLSVNFPSDTIVKLQKGNVEKTLISELCHCKNSRVIALYR